MSLTEKSFWPRGWKQKNNEKKVYNRWLFRKTNMFFYKVFLHLLWQHFFPRKIKSAKRKFTKIYFFILTRANMKGESRKLRASSENQRYFSNFLQMKLSVHKPFIKTLNNDNSYEIYKIQMNSIQILRHYEHTYVIYWNHMKSC